MLPRRFSYQGSFAGLHVRSLAILAALALAAGWKPALRPSPLVLTLF